MSLPETRTILQDLCHQFLLAEELDLIQSATESKRKAARLCHEHLEFSRKEVQYLTAELEMAERKLADVKAQLQRERHENEMRQLEQQRVDLEIRIKQSQQAIQKFSGEHDATQAELESLHSEAASHELDVIALRLKIFRSIGFDWQGSKGSSSSLPLTKCRVRPATKNDVQTVLLESEPERRFFMANHLWDIVSGSNSN